MNRATVNWEAARRASNLNGSRSIGPVSRLAAINTAIVPPFSRNIRAEPPTSTIPNAVKKATSAIGSENMAPAMVAKMSRRLACVSPTTSAPSSTAARTAALTMGTAISTWKVVSAMNWIATSCQLAAPSSAPRFRSSFRSKSVSVIVCCLQRMIPTWRIVRAGLVAAVAVGLAGWAYERVRFGASDQDSLIRTETELRQRFNAAADTLGEIAARVKSDLEAIRLAPRDTAAARRLFVYVDGALPQAEAGRTGLTIYGPSNAPLAWAGRVSELPKE